MNDEEYSKQVQQLKVKIHQFTIDVDESVLIPALANLLVINCNIVDLKKEKFLQLIEKTWDSVERSANELKTAFSMVNSVISRKKNEDK